MDVRRGEYESTLMNDKISAAEKREGKKDEARRREKRVSFTESEQSKAIGVE